MSWRAADLDTWLLAVGAYAICLLVLVVVLLRDEGDDHG